MTRYAWAVMAGLLCSQAALAGQAANPAAQAAPGPGDKPAASDKPAADAKGAATPEEALANFLKGMIECDLTTVSKNSLAKPRLEILCKGDKLTAEQKAESQKAIDPANFRRLKVNDIARLPGGKKYIVTRYHVNDTRQEIVMGKSPIPFIVVKEGERWKVDPSPLIAARTAAARVREKHKRDRDSQTESPPK
jgi:hypothetical protein